MSRLIRRAKGEQKESKMKVIVKGLTESILTLNKIGIPIQGLTEAILDINTDEQQQELDILVNVGLIEILERIECSKKTKNKTSPKKSQMGDNASNNSSNAEGKKKRGRPSGAKGKPKSQIDQGKKDAAEAEAETQKEGSTVVISTGGDTSKGKMTHSAIGEYSESERTKKSLEAMEKLQEEEEHKDTEDFDPQDMAIDDSELDPSEQMGREAIVGTGAGEQKVKMTNSSVPEADAIKQIDPFIDREDKKEIEAIEKAQEEAQEAKEKDSKEKSKAPVKPDEEILVDTKTLGDEKDDYSDSFIEV